MDKIRLATIEDIDAVKAIAQNAYLQYVSIMGRKPAPMVADFSEHLENDTVFVAEGDEGEPVGYAVIIIKDGDYWLENIAVEPAQCNKGIGKKLIDHVETYISKRANKYQLYTNVKMAENIEWYNRLGFKETKRATENEFERVFFVKEL